MGKFRDLTKKLFKGRGKRFTVAAVYAVGLLSGGFLFYQNASIVKVGANSTYYTYADINTYYSFANKIAKITGGQPISSRSVAFQMLTVAAMEKELLTAKKVALNKERAIELVEAQSVVGGLLKEQKAKMGEDAYYHVIIEPAAIGQLFVSYYRANDPSGKLAQQALEAALEGGLGAAVQKAGKGAVQVKVPVLPANAAFVEQARQHLGSVIPKVVEDESGYSIVQVKDVGDKEIVAEVVSIPRKPFGKFLRDELQAAGIPYKSSFYSWFRVSDLEKPGAIFAEVKQSNK